MAINYKDLGLVNTRDMFKKAVAGGYAIPAYNFNNMEQLQAIIAGCVESESSPYRRECADRRSRMGTEGSQLLESA